MVYKKISEMNKFDWFVTFFLGLALLAKFMWTFGNSDDTYAANILGIFSIIIVFILLIIKIIFKIK